MSRTRRWLDDADARMAEMQQLWNSISSPKSPILSSTPKRSTKSTLIPVAAETPEGLERKARAKAREQKRALELELNRKRLKDHHRKLKNVKSHWAEGHLPSPAATTPKAMKASLTPNTDDACASRKSYEQQSQDFQSVRRALRKSLTGSVARDISVEFVLPKERHESVVSGTAKSDSVLLAQFGEQHDLRPIRRLNEY